MTNTRKTVTPFAKFIGNQKLDLSSNKAEAKKLIETLTQQNLSEFFQKYDKKFLNEFAHHIAYAFSENFITQEQLITLLELRSLLLDFTEVQIITIFDSKGQITERAKSILNLFLGEQDHNTFLEKIKSLPLSEQNFFSFEDTENIESITPLVNLAIELHIIKNNRRPINLSQGEEKNTKKPIPKNLSLTKLSAGAIKIITEMRYKKHMKELMPKLGKLTINDIEEGMRDHRRCYHLDFPGIKTSEKFHNIQAKSFYLSLHDELHRQLISSIPNAAYDNLFYAIDLIRKKTKIHWSRELWNTIDMEFADFFLDSNERRDDLSEKVCTENFLKLINAKVYSNQGEHQLTPSSTFSEITWLLILDIALYSSEWKKRNINPDYFPQNSEYYNIYQFILKEGRKIIKKEIPVAAQVAQLMALHFNISLEIEEKSISFQKKNTTYCKNVIQLCNKNETLFFSKDQIKLLSSGSSYNMKKILSDIAKEKLTFSTCSDISSFLDIIVREKQFPFREITSKALYNVWLLPLLQDKILTIQELDSIPTEKIPKFKEILYETIGGEGEIILVRDVKDSLKKLQSLKTSAKNSQHTFFNKKDSAQTGQTEKNLPEKNK